jgi:hypothetical protein
MVVVWLRLSARGEGRVAGDGLVATVNPRRRVSRW